MDKYKYYRGAHRPDLFKIADEVESCIVQLGQDSIAMIYDNGSYDEIPFKKITKEIFEQELELNGITELLKFLNDA